MGCGQSKPSDGLEEQIAELRLLLADSQTSSNEQQNLLRFKIEVLVNMLAMEEKKSESTNKRLETLKWLMHSQGVSEQTLTDILMKSEEIYNENSNNSSTTRDASFRGLGLIDLAGAMARMTEDFASFRDDILHTFAEVDGKIVANLTSEEFAKQLYVVTEKVSKSDIHILSMRFSDGLGSVSIPEFLEFFTTPVQVRQAKAATSAVRMSLDLLQLKNDSRDEYEEEDEEEEEPGSPMSPKKPLTVRSHRTDKLEIGVQRLLALWHLVQKDLETAFTLFEQPDEDGKIVSTEIFKKTLTDNCGKKSITLRRAILDAQAAAKPQSPAVGASQKLTPNDLKKPPLATSKSTSSLASSNTASDSNPAAAPIVPLDETDVNLLTTRFELGGMVDYGMFMQYFADEANRQGKKKRKAHLPASMGGISPFRLSSEWVALKNSAEIGSRGTPPPLGGQSSMGIADSKVADSPVTKAPPKAEEKAAKQPATPVVKPPVTPTPAAESKGKETPSKGEAKPDAKDSKLEDKPEPVAVPPVEAVEVVKSSGCCGSSRKPPANPPAELAPAPAAPKTKEVPVPESKDSPLNIETDEQSDEEPEGLKLTKDTSFNTPKGILSKKNSSGPAAFKPKVITGGRGPGGMPNREGLGLHDDTEDSGRGAPAQSANSSGSSRFHRRADKNFENERRANPLDEEEDQEISQIDHHFAVNNSRTTTARFK